eukprot:COSAG01_NODE_455_length_16792_cov_112.440424_2_plen_80_part_00
MRRAVGRCLASGCCAWWCGAWFGVSLQECGVLVLYNSGAGSLHAAVAPVLLQCGPALVELPVRHFCQSLHALRRRLQRG